MLFHTWPFLLFFLLVYTVYLSLRKTKYWLHWLLLSSYFFYGWWNPLYLILIAYSTLLDYVIVRWMEKSARKKLLLVVSLANNLFLLGFFKYADFVVENINAMLTGLGVSYLLQKPNILLPVGISFYTFQSMSYTIDYYRGEIKCERSFVRFAAFVSLFPQLVAGPIERASRLLPQLISFPKIKLQDVSDGLSLFVVGLFKKLALANYLALYVDEVYANPGIQSGSALLLGTFAFAWQIYFDFSGYTDMARGIARIFGFRLMLNFNNPYLATGLSDFWGRWHISLSTWFRDYVYIPLGGSRFSRRKLYRNLMVAFIISGLWHGAAWTFIIWGFLHALGVITTRQLERSAWYINSVPKIVKQGLTFAFVCLAWIFFRAESLNDAGSILSRIFSAAWGDPRFPILALSLMLSIWFYQFLYETKRTLRMINTSVVKVALVSFMIVYLCLIPGTPEKAFIYFQF